MIQLITEVYYERGGTPNQLGNCGVEIDYNYYDMLEGEDINKDGYIDQGYSVCNWVIERQNSRFVVDVHASFTPYPAYNEFNLKVEKPDNRIPEMIVGVTLLIIASAFGSKVYFGLSKSKPVFDGELSGKPAEIVKDLFKSQTILYYTLVGQTRIGNEELEVEVKKAIPSNFLDHRYLFHPVKLSIVKLLYENLEFTSIELKNILEVSWNDFHTHASSLEKKGYLRIEDEFVSSVKRQMLRLEQKGIQEYKITTDLLHLFLDNSTDYKAYIDAA